MKKSALIVALALALPALSTLGQDQGGQPPAGGPPPGLEGGGLGGPPPGVQPGAPGFHIVPPPIAQQLNLTADQQKQLADLEAETKAKLEAILTPEQLEKLKQMRPPMGRGMRGPGGPRRGPPPGAGENAPQPPAAQ